MALLTTAGGAQEHVILIIMRNNKEAGGVWLFTWVCRRGCLKYAQTNLAERQEIQIVLWRTISVIGLADQASIVISDNAKISNFRKKGRFSFPVKCLDSLTPDTLIWRLACGVLQLGGTRTWGKSRLRCQCWKELQDFYKRQLDVERVYICTSSYLDAKLRSIQAERLRAVNDAISHNALEKCLDK